MLIVAELLNHPEKYPLCTVMLRVVLMMYKRANRGFIPSIPCPGVGRGHVGHVGHVGLPATSSQLATCGRSLRVRRISGGIRGTFLTQVILV